MKSSGVGLTAYRSRSRLRAAERLIRRIGEKMAKKTNPTKDNAKEKTDSVKVIEEYFCLKEMQPRPVTMAYIEAVADMLVEFADMDNSLSMTGFYRATKIPQDCMQRWKEMSPRLKAAYNYALAVFGGRREEGAVTKRYDTGAVWKMQYQYGPQYRESMEFAARLARKDDLDDVGGMKFIIMQPMQTDASMEKYFKTENKIGKNDGRNDACSSDDISKI